MFLGARSATMASKPFQNTSLATPVPGSTLSSMKRYSTVATCRRWLAVRGVDVGVVMVSSLKSNVTKDKAKLATRSRHQQGQHIAQAAAGVGGLGAQFFKRQLVAVDPERPVAKPGGGQCVPAVAADKAYLPRRQARRLFAQRVGFGGGLVGADAVGADDMVEQAVQPGRFDGHGQHGRVAVGQNAGDEAACFQRLQHLFVLGESAQMPVLVHQLL